ncbi:hypothetical protein BDK51DRAFT_29803, partial [Blyttiomyces helicus]
MGPDRHSRRKTKELLLAQVGNGPTSRFQQIPSPTLSEMALHTAPPPPVDLNNVDGLLFAPAPSDFDDILRFPVSPVSSSSASERESPIPWTPRSSSLSPPTIPACQGWWNPPGSLADALSNPVAPIPHLALPAPMSGFAPFAVKNEPSCCDHLAVRVEETAQIGDRAWGASKWEGSMAMWAIAAAGCTEPALPPSPPVEHLAPTFIKMEGSASSHLYRTSPTPLRLASVIEPARGARRFAADADFGCSRCGTRVGTLVVHGDRRAVEAPYIVDVVCLTCKRGSSPIFAPAVPTPVPIRKRGRRALSSDSMECDCCKKRIAHGVMRPVEPELVEAPALATMYDIICTSCRPRYSLCTQCGGGGG